MLADFGPDNVSASIGVVSGPARGPDARLQDKGKEMINKELLDILACPQCKGPVKLQADESGLVCEPCGLLYEIIDDIPVMLIDKAKKLGDQEHPA